MTARTAGGPIDFFSTSFSVISDILIECIGFSETLLNYWKNSSKPLISSTKLKNLLALAGDCLQNGDDNSTSSGLTKTVGANIAF